MSQAPPILPSGIWCVKRSATAQRLPPPTNPPPLPLRHIFTGGVPHTPPYCDYSLSRPIIFENTGRNFYEPVDMPRWEKHVVVEQQIRRQNLFGSFTHLVQSLYDLDTRAGARLARDRCLDQVEGIAGFILVCLGIDHVKVPLAAIQVLETAEFTPDIFSTVELDSNDTWVVLLVYFEGGSEEEVGYWMAAIWHNRARELYCFDALDAERTERRNLLQDA